MTPLLVPLLFPLLFLNPTISPQPPLSIHNLTLTLPTNATLPPTTNTTIPPTTIHPQHCTRRPRWTRPSFHKEDCQGALGHLHYETMGQGGLAWIEFLAPGAKATRHTRRERTPRRYTFGTCTLAMVLLDDYPSPTTLPGGGSRTGPPTDLSTYSRLNLVAQNVVEKCVVGRGEAGWQLTGQSDGIGVFVWATDSAEDKEIDDDDEGRDGVGTA